MLKGAILAPSILYITHRSQISLINVINQYNLRQQIEVHVQLCQTTVHIFHTRHFDQLIIWEPLNLSLY